MSDIIDIIEDLISTLEGSCTHDDNEGHKHDLFDHYDRNEFQKIREKLQLLKTTNHDQADLPYYRK